MATAAAVILIAVLTITRERAVAIAQSATEATVANTATTMLMVEVKAFKIAIQRDSLKVGYQNTRNPAGPLIAWIPPSLRTVLMEDKYVYYYDSATESEIQLLVEPCNAEGTPQNRPPDQRVPDARPEPDIFFNTRSIPD